MDTPFPRRTVHLDFHTSPHIPGIGKNFDPDVFAETFKEACVDSVTVFAKCHHGHLYYNTARPERHPGLAKNFDLLNEQIEALHRRGIRAPIYVSVQVDEYAAHTHPEWCAVDPDGRIVKNGGPLGAGWHTLDMSSPYQDFLAEQIDEVLSRFAPLDGLFLDMCWDQPSCSQWAMDGMRSRGYDPCDDGDRGTYAREIAHEYMARFKKMVDKAHRNTAPVGIWFNSRPKTNLHFEKKFLRHIEVECLPTGGWGYAYFPYVARFVRPLGLPTLSHTGRFHKSWGDFNGLKPRAAMLYECASILSMGLTNGIGDQLHPRGTLEKEAYARIGKAYNHIQACEPWVEDAKLVSQIGVIIDPQKGDQPGPTGLGVVRALQQLRHQFDLLPSTGPIRSYDLIIVPESVKIDFALRRKLATYLKNGGTLLVSGDAALDERGKPVLPELGIRPHGLSPYTVTYLRPDRSTAAGLPQSDFVMYEQGYRFTLAKTAKSLCRVVEPYFERGYDTFCSHGQTPPAKLSRYAAAVLGKNTVTFSMPIFSAYGLHGNLEYRDLLGKCIDLLLPEPLIRDEGPGHLEATVLRKGKRTIVHLISFYPANRTESGQPEIIEDAFPLVDMPLSVRLDKKPKRVVLAPEDREVPFRYAKGRAEVRVTCTAGHTMVVFD
ncbi:MAG: hypothetical protein GY851_29445 [bacterium]|nr:hypothetical protein [bacterium]